MTFANFGTYANLIGFRGVRHRLSGSCTPMPKNANAVGIGKAMSGPTLHTPRFAHGVSPPYRQPKQISYPGARSGRNVPLPANFEVPTTPSSLSVRAAVR